jgi:phage terminase large subunit
VPELVLPHNWQPRPYQRKLWNYLETGGKRAIAIWHRRAGKDDVALHWSATAAIERPGTYWHMLPEYSQARKAIWTAVNPHSGKRRIDEAFPHELRANTNEQEMFLRLVNGSTWQVIGSDNYSSLVGTPPAGIVFSEWARANPAAWAYLAPILAENSGWSLFITTPVGRNHALSMLTMARANPTWFADIQTVDDSKAISLEIVEQQRQEYHALFGEDAGDALIQQEYWCSFNAAVLGAFWGKEMNAAERDGRICDLPIDRDYPVHTAWDLGIDDSMAIWCFQIAPGVLHVVDYYESSGHGFEHYCQWLDDRSYHGIDWVPHDARMRELGAPGGRTRIESLVALGRKPKIVPNQKLIDGINAGRKTIPVARFDEKRCAKGLEALRAYKAEWDEEARAFKRTPDHDWASHGADAWRYLSLAWKFPAKPREPKEPEPMRGIGNISVDEFIKLSTPPRMRV